MDSCRTISLMSICASGAMPPPKNFQTASNPILSNTMLLSDNPHKKSWRVTLPFFLRLRACRLIWICVQKPSDIRCIYFVCTVRPSQASTNIVGTLCDVVTRLCLSCMTPTCSSLAAGTEERGGLTFLSSIKTSERATISSCRASSGLAKFGFSLNMSRPYASTRQDWLGSRV